MTSDGESGRSKPVLKVPAIIGVARRLGFRPRWAGVLLFLHLGSVLFEGVGIGMFLPVMELMNNDSDVERLAAESGLWRHIVNVFEAVSVPLNLATLLGAAFLGLLLRQLFLYMRNVYTARVQNGLICELRGEAFERYLNARLEYHDDVSAGNFVNELTVEMVRAVHALFAFIALAGYLLLGTMYLGLLLAISATSTFAAFGVILATVFMLRGVLARSRLVGDAFSESNQRMASFLVERLKSVHLVRLSGTERAEVAEMRERVARQRDHFVHFTELQALVQVLIEPMVVGVAFLLLYGSVTFLELSFERVLLFMMMIVRLLPVIKEAMAVRQFILTATASLEIVDQRLESMRLEIEPRGGSGVFGRLERGMTLDEVSYDYETGAGIPTLDRISFEIPARKVTALVGPSGSGKSTLIDLLPRLRDARSGSILLDDQPIESFSTQSLRAGIAYAPQFPRIFNVSAAEHIRYGRPGASMDEVRAAARLAGIADFIEALPDGYDTLLGEAGARLSGGERQRIDLARALVRQAQILILDEPTSNLDAESEERFRDAIRRVREQTEMTIVIIGHRLSTVVDADRIVVLEAGRVREIGTHEELMQSEGWYSRAFSSQHGGGFKTEPSTRSVAGSA